MRFKIKKISDFIKEGAYIDANNNVVVSKKNHSDDESEKLKTSDLQVSGSNKRYAEGKSGSHVEVYYGLYPIGKEEDVIPEQNWIVGRNKDGNEVTLNTIKTRYMDSLKSGNFSMAAGETLGDFINSDIKRKFSSGLDYIVTIESSKALVPLMGEELKMIYPNATLIQLSKNVYQDPSHIFDIESAEIAGSNEQRLKNEEFIKDFMEKEMLVRKEEEEGKRDPRGYILKSTGKSESLVKDALMRELREWEKLTPEEKEEGYKISTSNKLRGSIRKFIAAKYNLRNEDLKNAIYDCLVKSNDPNNDVFYTTKKMVILDDNTNTGLDFGEIAKGIQEFVNTEIKPLIGEDAGYQIRPIEENILGYVFYKMQTPEGHSGGSQLSLKVKKSKVQGLEKDIKLAYNTFREMYANKGLEGLGLTQKSINSTINDLIRKKGISATPDEIAKVIGLAVY